VFLGQLSALAKIQKSMDQFIVLDGEVGRQA
jgi:hypothetical protein